MTHKIASVVTVKVGGNAMDASAEAGLGMQIAGLHERGHAVVVVHGGGPEIDAALAQAGITSARIDGLRVTSPDALAIAHRVLWSQINARLVATLSAAGIEARGFNGSAGIIAATPVDRSRYGCVGTVTTVDASPIAEALAAGLVPVVAPLAYDPKTGGALNVNADTAAAAVAVALRSESFLLLTNVERVRLDPRNAATGVDCMPLAQARDFISDAACEGSMRPKLQAAIDAVAAGVQRACIGAASLVELLEGKATVIFA